MNIVLNVSGKKKEKVVYQKIPGSNPGQDYEKSCWPNGKASDYGNSTILTIFHKPIN